MGSDGRRIFLGWDEPFLPRAARALIEDFRARGSLDLSACVVVLPGRRAARRFEELCAELAGDAWVPPRVITASALPEALAREPLSTLSPLGRTLAWVAALRSLPGAEAERVFARPALERTLGEDLAIGRRLARASAELASEGLDFASVADRRELHDTDRGRARWRALGRMEGAYASTLAALERIDPSRAASEVVGRGLVREDLEVWLAGVADLSGAERALLERIGSVTSLIFAPPALAEGFDAWGAVSAEFWAERDLPLASESWRVVQGADEQARGAVEWLRELSERGGASPLRAEAATIGALDPALAPHLDRRLAEAGVPTHWAGGTPIDRALPVRLLRALLEFGRTRGWPELAALARHPDLEAALVRGLPLGAADLATVLDRYFEAHLPARAGNAWVPDGDGRRLERAHASLDSLLGALASDERRELSSWSGELKRFLQAVHPEVEPDARDPGERQLVEALAKIGSALAEVDELAGTLLDSPALAPAAVIEIVLDRLADETLPPLADAGSVEIVGWLELALDEAPHLLLAGWNEGHLPSPGAGDPFLSNDARRALGLPDDARRLARDVYAAETILRSRRSVRAQSSRRGSDGEPARPSRFTFRCAPEEVRLRVERFFARSASEAAPPAEAGAEPRRALAFVPHGAPATMSPTSFKLYLEAPYLFYLRYVLRLDTLDDAARELDPLGFGNLTHEVLHAFGQSGVRDSRDEAAIAGFLSRALDELAQAKFGTDVLPAVLLQVEQLRARLAGFARWQARSSAEGWRIAEVELEASFALEVDGAPMAVRGRIDRLDRHPERGWRVLDYKSGERGDGPEKSRRRDGTWLDLQLPLYRAMVRERCGDAPVRLGYVVLPPEPARVGERLAPWTEADLEHALEAARDVVRGVRRGDFTGTGTKPPPERVFAALAGFGLLGGGEGDELAAAGAGEEEGA